jgi:predicted dehydrogenase
MSTLKGICVGAGYFSRFQYEAWTRIPEVEILAACNRNVERAQDVADTYGIPRVFGWNELATALDELKPNFVDIITPPETHKEAVILAAERGIDVICQKPLAPSLEESEEIVEIANEAGIRFMVHENWRWQPWYREIKRQISLGAIGDLHSISVLMRMGDGWQKDAYLARQPFFRDYPRLLIYETGVHFLDTFRYLSGEIESIYARLQKRNPDIAGEDAGQVVAGFASGATAILDSSRYNEAICENPRYTFGTVRVDGSAGHIELATDGSLTFKQLGEKPRPIEYAHNTEEFAGGCVFNLQRHFVESMQNGKPFESTGEDYLKTVALVEACYRSNATGEVEKL